MSQRKYFYVRITSVASDDFWYTDAIGKVFLVFEPYDNSWGFETKTNGFSIFRHDCERVAK